MRQGMTEGMIGLTFGILTLVLMALPFLYRPYPDINLSGYDLMQGSFTYRGSLEQHAFSPYPLLWLDVAAGAVVAFLGFIALLSSLGSDWRSRASILKVLDESMLVGGTLVVIGSFFAMLEVLTTVNPGGPMNPEAWVIYPVFGFWALVGLGFLMNIVGSRLMKMEWQRGAGGLIGGLNQTGVKSQELMAATSAVLSIGMLLYIIGLLLSLYIRTVLVSYLSLVGSIILIVGSIILIVTYCLFAAATSKSPLGLNASAIGIASGAINMLFWIDIWNNWVVTGYWYLDGTQVVLVCVLLATSAVLTGGFFIKKRNLSKKPGAWKKAGILYMITGACFGSIILSYLIPFSFLVWLWGAVVGREAFINE